MSRRSRWFQVSILVVVTALAWCQPQTASAWHGRWHAGFGGFGFRPWCGPVFGPRFYGGWGGWYGGTRYFASNTVYLGGPFGGGLFSGSVNSFVIGGPRWCGPAWGWGGGLPCTYFPSPYGYGYSPVLVTPYGGWLPASFAPVYGPRGVLPFMGVSTNGPVAAVQAIAARPGNAAAMTQLAARGAAAALAAPPAPPFAARGSAPTIAVRPSNGVARLRAARLVAVGDRHLRNAVNDPARLPSALDAYRRAATIAPDLADTFLRQAIVLTALERDADAARAVDRAVAIDARLGDDPQAALAARERLPPDPVFGDRPDSEPTTLAARSEHLLGRIFTDAQGAVPAADGQAVAAADRANWIAGRWLRQWQGPVDAVAAR